MTEVAQVENAPAAPPPEIVQEAEQGGWVPKEKFRGNEAEWVDAETFVKRGREINPILRKHNAELKRELAQAKAQAEEAVQAAREFRAFQKERFEEKKQEFESQIKQLREAKKAAITDGDGTRAVELDEAIDSLREEQAALKAPVTPPQPKVAASVDPELTNWIENNRWYGKDTDDSIERTEITNGIAMSIRRRNPTLVGKAFLDELDKQIDEKMPDWRGKKREKPNNPVEGNSSGGTTRSGNGKSYSDLPADAKAACDRYVKQKILTREQYVADYFE